MCGDGAWVWCLLKFEYERSEEIELKINFKARKVLNDEFINAAWNGWIWRWFDDFRWFRRW